MLSEGLAVRDDRRFRSGLRTSKLPHHKTIDEYDFSFQPELDPRKVKDLATLSFVEAKANAALLGPPGVGKTHIAVALAVAACRAGYSIYFTSLDDMVRNLKTAEAAGRLTSKLGSYLRPGVLVVDEVGYQPLERAEANLVFQIISKRYEKGSIILTSNKTDLSSRHIPVAVRGAVTLRGVKAHLEGVAIVKVGGSEDSIRAAAQRFLMQQDGIVGFTQEVLSGALRAIVGRMSVEDIIRDRAAFAGQVAEEAEASLSGQGLVLDAFQIQDISTEGSYLEDLGRPEAARAKQEADIAEADRPPRGRAGPAEGRGGDRHRAADVRAEAGRDQGRDRRGRRPRRCRRPAGRSRAIAGGPRRAGEGRRAAGRADRPRTGHPGPQARRRRPLPGRTGGRGPPHRPGQGGRGGRPAVQADR